MELAFSAAFYVRPTGQRLVVALGIAAVLVVVLLTFLAGFRFYLSNPGTGQRTELTVYIKKHEPLQEVESTPTEPTETQPTKKQIPTNNSATASAPQSDQDTFAQDATRQPIESNPVRDWHSMAQEVIRSQLSEEFRQDIARSQLWRQSPSIMFRPGNGREITEIQPVLPDVPFKPEIHVFGLGITVGSCFIGIPIVGIPVEERSVGPTIFYCAHSAK